MAGSDRGLQERLAVEFAGSAHSPRRHKTPDAGLDPPPHSYRRSRFLIGAAGDARIVVAAVIESSILLFLAFIVHGPGTTTNPQTRYGCTGLAPAQSRERRLDPLQLDNCREMEGPSSLTALGSLARARQAGWFG